jgi:hypothetical protein
VPPSPDRSRPANFVEGTLLEPDQQRQQQFVVPGGRSILFNTARSRLIVLPMLLLWRIAVVGICWPNGSTRRPAKKHPNASGDTCFLQVTIHGLSIAGDLGHLFA